MRPWFSAKRDKKPIVIVSGLPRSGTSLMMQMLAAGGYPVLTDGVRTADADNPHGYFELEAVKRLPQGDTAWLADAPGRAVKVIAALLPYLPLSEVAAYRIVFMRRHTAEIVASQAKMLARRGVADGLHGHGAAQAVLEAHLQATGRWLRQSRAAVLEVYFEDVLARPWAESERVAGFVGGGLAVAEMTTAVDGALYRHQHERSLHPNMKQG